MSRRSTALLKASLSALHYAGADHLLAPFAQGIGAVLMLHRVCPAAPEPFEPNRILRVTPDFLDQTIRQIGAAGFDFVSMDEVAARLSEGDMGRPFVAFTLDDGYRDNLTHAYPVFARHDVPFTVYVPTDYADGTGDLWWLTLEAVLRARDALEIRMQGKHRSFRLDTVAGKELAYHQIYWWLRGIDERNAREVVAELAADCGIDARVFGRRLMMDWSEIRGLATDPRVTIGAHTRRHCALSKLSLAEATDEIAMGVSRLERELARPCRHFSYPFGDESAAGEREFTIVRELGLSTAVTTRKGLLHRDHADRRHALPRISLNGDYQHARYVKVLLSGAPFLFWDMARRLSARA
jgi:peptidoglycan/xylan/chitin deacetylase (PgdA/CDA1 family)